MSSQRAAGAALIKTHIKCVCNELLEEMWNTRGITSCRRKENVSSFRHKAQEDESSLSVGMLISDRRKSALNKVTVLSACKGRHVYTDGLI